MIPFVDLRSDAQREANIFSLNGLKRISYVCACAACVGVLSGEEGDFLAGRELCLLIVEGDESRRRQQIGIAVALQGF